MPSISEVLNRQKAKKKKDGWFVGTIVAGNQVNPGDGDPVDYIPVNGLSPAVGDTVLCVETSAGRFLMGVL